MTAESWQIQQSRKEFYQKMGKFTIACIPTLSEIHLCMDVHDAVSDANTITTLFVIIGMMLGRRSLPRLRKLAIMNGSVSDIFALMSPREFFKTAVSLVKLTSSSFNAKQLLTNLSKITSFAFTNTVDQPTEIPASACREMLTTCFAPEGPMKNITELDLHMLTSSFISLECFATMPLRRLTLCQVLISDNSLTRIIFNSQHMTELRLIQVRLSSDTDRWSRILSQEMLPRAYTDMEISEIGYDEIENPMADYCQDKALCSRYEEDLVAAMGAWQSVRMRRMKLGLHGVAGRKDRYMDGIEVHLHDGKTVIEEDDTDDEEEEEWNE